MAFLTINGRNYDVSTSSAQESAPRMVGTVVTTFAGILRVTRRVRKRVYGFVLAPMPVATYEQLVADVATAIVPVTGDAVNGGAFQAVVDVTNGVFVSDMSQPHYHQRSAAIVISEV